MIRYLFKVFNQIYIDKLKGDFKMFDMYNNQIMNPNAGQGTVYPAVFVEFIPTTQDYLNNKVLQTKMTVNFYLAFRSAASTRYGNRGQDYALQQYALLEKFNRAFDGICKEVLILQPQYNNLTDDEDYFTFGVVDRATTDKLPRYKTTEITKVSYEYILLDNSRTADDSLYYTFQKLSGINPVIISGETILTALEFELFGNFTDDYSDSDFF